MIPILKCLRRSGMTAAAALLVLLGALDGVSTHLSLPGTLGVLHAKDGRGGGDGGGRGGGDGGGRGGGDREGGDRGGGNDGGRGKDGGNESSRGHGRDRDDDRSGRRRDDAVREGQSVSRFMDRLAKHGQVTWSRMTPGSMSVRYADGWTETIEKGRYSLRDGDRRTVAERAARPADTARLNAAANTR